MKKLARIALVTALALTLAAVFAVSAGAEANEKYTIIIKVVDVEDETSVLATGEYALCGSGATAWIYPWSYCPQNCIPVSYDAIPVTAGVDDEVVIKAKPLKTYLITYRLINADNPQETLRTGVAKVAGHYGDRAYGPQIYGALPIDWYISYPLDDSLTLGVDESIVYYLRRYKSYPITIEYYDIADPEGNTLSQSSITIKGGAGVRYSVQPEDGLMPYGYSVLDSSEVELKLGLESVARFPVQKLQSYTIKVMWVDASDSSLVRLDNMPISGLPGWEMRYNSYMEGAYPNNPPYGWQLVKQDYPVITLGSTDTCYLKIAKPEYFNISIKYVNKNTEELVLTQNVCLYGLRGDTVNVDFYSMRPDEYSMYSSPNAPVLGTDTELTAYVIPSYINPNIYQTYTIKAILWDVDTMQSLGTQTLSVRGIEGNSVGSNQMAISIPNGYRELSNSWIYLGTTNEIDLYYYSIARHEHPVTLRGVSILDPSKAITETEVDVDYYSWDYMTLYMEIMQIMETQPPEGYVLDDNINLPTFHDPGNGLPIVYTYYLTPIERYEATLRFVNADNPSELVEERVVSYYNGSTSIEAEDAYGCKVLPPEGWRLVYNDNTSFVQYYRDYVWLNLHPWQTEPITIPVVKDGGYAVTVKLVNALRPDEVASSKTVTVDRPMGFLMQFSRYDYPCPDDWKYSSMSTSNNTIRIGYDDSVTFYVLPVLSSRPALLPDDLTSIAEGAFAGTSLTNVMLPNGLRSIGAGAFSGCAGLKYVSIPESVTDIGEGAFAGCPNLVVICTAGSDAESYAKANGLYSYTGDQLPVYAP